MCFAKLIDDKLSTLLLSERGRAYRSLVSRKCLFRPHIESGTCTMVLNPTSYPLRLVYMPFTRLFLAIIKWISDIKAKQNRSVIKIMNSIVSRESNYQIHKKKYVHFSKGKNIYLYQREDRHNYNHESVFFSDALHLVSVFNVIFPITKPNRIAKSPSTYLTTKVLPLCKSRDMIKPHEQALTREEVGSIASADKLS